MWPSAPDAAASERTAADAISACIAAFLPNIGFQTTPWGSGRGPALRHRQVEPLGELGAEGDGVRGAGGAGADLKAVIHFLGVPLEVVELVLGAGDAARVEV